MIFIDNGLRLPAAIGAKVAAPYKTVIDVDGDASFSMTAMELQTASQFGIGVKVLVLNNRFQGMVLQWQGIFNAASSLAHLAFSNLSALSDLFYDARYSHTSTTNPDFILLAQAMGVHAIRCETHEELPAKMKEFLQDPGNKPVFGGDEGAFQFHSGACYGGADVRALGSGWEGPARADITQVVEGTE